MKAEIAKRLVLAFPGLTIPATGVAHVAGVAEAARYARKPQQLRPLRLEIDKGTKLECEGVAAPLDDVADAIEERAAIISETCPAPYVDAFARLNHQKPASVSSAEWLLAVNDAGRFLDAWGTLAAILQWGAGELFDEPNKSRPGGLVWHLKGGRVEALETDHARLGDGRTVKRSESNRIEGTGNETR